MSSLSAHQRATLVAIANGDLTTLQLAVLLTLHKYTVVSIMDTLAIAGWFAAR